MIGPWSNSSINGEPTGTGGGDGLGGIGCISGGVEGTGMDVGVGKPLEGDADVRSENRGGVNDSESSFLANVRGDLGIGPWQLCFVSSIIGEGGIFGPGNTGMGVSETGGLVGGDVGGIDGVAGVGLVVIGEFGAGELGRGVLGIVGGVSGGNCVGGLWEGDLGKSFSYHVPGMSAMGSSQVAVNVTPYPIPGW